MNRLFSYHVHHENSAMFVVMSKWLSLGNAHILMRYKFPSSGSTWIYSSIPRNMMRGTTKSLLHITDTLCWVCCSGRLNTWKPNLDYENGNVGILNENGNVGILMKFSSLAAQKLSKWQLLVKPMMNILTKWCLFGVFFVMWEKIQLSKLQISQWN